MLKCVIYNKADACNCKCLYIPTLPNALCSVMSVYSPTINTTAAGASRDSPHIYFTPYHTTCPQVQHECDTANARLTNAKAELVHATKTTEHLSGELSTLRADSTALRQQLAAAQEGASKAASLEVLVAALESKLSDAHAAMAAHADDGPAAEALRVHVAALEAQQTQLEAALTESTSISEQWKDAYEALEAQRVEAEQRAAAADAEAEALRAARDARVAQAAALGGPVDAERVLELTERVNAAENQRWVVGVGSGACVDYAWRCLLWLWYFCDS